MNGRQLFPRFVPHLSSLIQTTLPVNPPKKRRKLKRPQPMKVNSFADMQSDNDNDSDWAMDTQKTPESSSSDERSVGNDFLVEDSEDPLARVWLVSC